jgi:hypothetical protein
MVRLLVAALLAYLAVDLSSPVIPGAFEFDPARSAEGVRGARLLPNPPAIAPAADPPRTPAPRVATTPRPGQRVRPAPAVGPRRPLERAHLPPSPAPAAPGDDH